MNCQEVNTLTHAYVDGELDLVRSLEVEKHFSTCTSCARLRENLGALKTTMKTPGLYFEAPAPLERQIRGALPQIRHESDRRPWRGSFWFSAVLPIACSAVLVVTVLVSGVWNSSQTQLAEQVTASHIRSLMVDHKTDVASSDQHTVKPWFDGKLDFAPPVVDLADRGFPLIGGRLDYLQDRAVAALVYQRNKHVINLFVWPTGRQSTREQKSETHNGYNMVHWDSSGMTFWAVSDLNVAELKEFARMIDQGGHAP